MAVLPIVTGADTPVLRTKTTPVPKVTKEIKKLLKDMGDTVKDAEGLGIAAPQVGSSHRVCLALINGTMTPFINPTILSHSEETDVADEGCLSLPGLTVSVTRPTAVAISYLDENGKAQERQLEGLSARVTQHELDHLDGVLIVDYR